MPPLNVAALSCPAALGDFEHNLQKLCACLEAAHTQKADLVVLPMGVLGGMPLGGLAHLPSFVEAEAKALATLTHATRHWHPVCALGVRVVHAGTLLHAVAVCAKGQLWGLVPQTTPGPWPELEAGIQTCLPNLPPSATWTPPPLPLPLAPGPIPLGGHLFLLNGWILAFGVHETVATEMLCAPILQGLCQAYPWHFDFSPTPPLRAHCALVRANLCGGGGEWLFAGGATLTHAPRGNSPSPPLSTPPFQPAGLYGLLQAPPHNTSIAPPPNSIALPFEAPPPPPATHLTPRGPSSSPLSPYFENTHVYLHPLWGKFETESTPACGLAINPGDNPNRAYAEGEDEAQNLECLWEALARGLGEYMEAAGCFQCVGLGLSGGRDSALALLAAWRWAKNQGNPKQLVHAFSMPSPHSSAQTRQAAQTLAAELGVSFAEHPIEAAYEREKKAVELMLGHAASELTLQNIQARIRTMRMWNWANSAQALFLQTGNHSEKAVGYTTLGGDFSGGFALLADLPKTWVVRLLSHIQQRLRLEGLGQIFSMPAGPELATGQTAETELMPFPLLDTLLEGFLGEGLTGKALLHFAQQRLPQVDSTTLYSNVQRIQKLVFLSQHKWHHAPPGLRLYSKSLRRFQWPLGAKLEAPVLHPTPGPFPT